MRSYTQTQSGPKFPQVVNLSCSTSVQIENNARMYRALDTDTHLNIELSKLRVRMIFVRRVCFFLVGFHRTHALKISTIEMWHGAAPVEFVSSVRSRSLETHLSATLAVAAHRIVERANDGRQFGGKKWANGGLSTLHRARSSHFNWIALNHVCYGRYGSICMARLIAERRCTLMRLAPRTVLCLRPCRSLKSSSL